MLNAFVNEDAERKNDALIGCMSKVKRKLI